MRGSFTTLGIDLAAQPPGTAACVIEWAGGRGEILSLDRGCGDAQLVTLAAGAKKIGIDAPLGWPRGFGERLARHAEGEPWTAPTERVGDLDRIAWRETDFAVRERTHHRPMAVGADTIARVAFRAAHLCSGLENELPSAEIDRSGVEGVVCEVYPGGLLRVAGKHPGGYGPTATARRANRGLILDFAAAAGITNIDRFRDDIIDERPSDALDSILCAIVAAMVENDETVKPPPEHEELAREEGWIHLPRD